MFLHDASSKVGSVASPHCAVLQNHVQACWGCDKAMSLKNFISLSHKLVDSDYHCLFTKPIAKQRLQSQEQQQFTRCSMSVKTGQDKLKSQLIQKL